MAPALQPGQLLLVVPSAPKRGDVVIVRSPDNEAMPRLKRVVGLPGDVLNAEDGLLFLNGAHLHERYLDGLPSVLGLDERWECRLTADRYFVMGDNRARSTDSRHFGPVPGAMITGKALLRLWPPGTLGRGFSPRP